MHYLNLSTIIYHSHRFYAKYITHKPLLLNCTQYIILLYFERVVGVFNGLYARHARYIDISGLRVKPRVADRRPMILFDDVVEEV